MGGWHDGYTNAALRMSQNLPNCRAIIGPWSHNWPDTVLPGPNIAFMDECLQFWEEHLKGVGGKWESMPRLRWYQCHGIVAPAPSVLSWPGHWQSGDGKEEGRVMFRFSDDGKLSPLQRSNPGLLASPVSVAFSGSAGLHCGEWLSFGAPDLANDQRSVAAYYGCWFTVPVSQPLHIMGHCEVSVICSVDTEAAQLYVGLCHVMSSSNGGYRLITYGVQNINGRYLIGVVFVIKEKKL